MIMARLQDILRDQWHNDHNRQKVSPRTGLEKATKGANTMEMLLYSL